MFLGFSFWEWASVIFALICAVFTYSIYINGYYQRKGLISASNPLPIFGNMLRVFLYKEHLLQTIKRAYDEHPDVKYVGFYAFTKPSTILRDLDLVKQITVKDFDHFVDHKVFMDADSDPLFGGNLFFLRGQKWKDMRIAMSPAYTSSKMKNMLPFIVECAEQTVTYLNKQIRDKKKSSDYLEVEMKDIFSRYTNDTIASTAFGVKVNSLENKTNKFYIMGKKATNFSGIQFFKFFAYSVFPTFMKMLNISLFPSDVTTFFRKLVYDSIISRESSGCIRYDMIHLLMLAKKGSLSHENEQALGSNGNEDDFYKFESTKREWTHDDLSAQAAAFLLAGFDTSSSLLCFTAYELALNPDIQKRLQEEIDDVILSNDNLNYSDLNKMKFMDMVISESLRMWPPDSQLERVCVKAFDLPAQSGTNSNYLQVQENDDIFIPIYAIHHDPRYHPDPDTFNPERFSAENKHLMHPASYIPFGIGPRTCIGARFAVMEAKAMIFFLLSKFNIVTTPKTPIPMILAADTFTMQSQKGFWLGLQSRDV